MSQSMRTELSRVRGLGSAHHGIQHWWMQRLTAIALLPLTVWFIYSVLNITAESADSAIVLQQQAQAYIANPFNALMAVLLVICAFQHLQLGLQVVIEDYVHNATSKFSSLIALKFSCFIIATACLLSIVMIVVR
ncbi:MAG: succinate dehydrogenase, hydrophobic membrane anchor protein [Alphaproteobacteria bacterium]|nr:succinate dehydrogenase, hydrophobic membrane anchor protein [Alphaproteobacteria bacterium]